MTLPPLYLYKDSLVNTSKLAWFFFAFIIFALLAISAQVSAAPSIEAPPPVLTPSGRIATEDELEFAQSEWALSAHADTFDNGMGANTTCAKCKSPYNWDPNQELAQIEALDCGACKRVPGAPRPELELGVNVAVADWGNIPCQVCHIPVDDSFYTGIAYWDQVSGSYQEVEDSMELCAHCHEGQHGFEVVEEQEASLVHIDMLCTDCHGSHGSPSACQDCHNPAVGSGAFEHERHPQVNCTACHDAGNLSIWYETDPGSPHFGEYITRRFAHALTSWPSHNLQTPTKCERCHHPAGELSAILASDVHCSACHPDGAVIFWCENFPRDLNPGQASEDYP